MVNKKSKAKKATAGAVNGVNGVASPSVGAPSTSEAPQMPQPSSSTESPAQKTSERPTASQEPEEDPKAQAEKIKEGGNVAFKAGKYRDAIDLYSRAIELNPSEPSYLTNRAASYMAIKKFRLALDDCQQAAALQSASPSPKTLLRLGRCQLALGSSAAALSTVRTVLTIEPKNAAAVQLRDKVHVLEGHMRNFDGAKKRRDWGLARLALDKCFETIEAEGEEIPAEWRTWKVELELCRRNWDAANIAANDALRLNPHSPDILAARGLVLFLGGKLPQALQHLASALRLDPGHEGARLLRIRVKDIEKLKEEGNIAFKSGRLQEAVDKYTEALDKIGDAEEEGGGGHIRATLLSNRATTSVKLGRHEEALTDTEASLALVPTSFKALRTRARINLHLEKFDAAVGDFHSAIEQAGVEGSDADVRALKGELKKAEVALKRSKAKDYYKILGVSRECTELEIKKAYRRESLKHHPDKGGDEEKFKLVVEAHAVLSDPQRRSRYDMGEDEDGSSSGMGGMGGMGGMNQADLAELFAQFNGGGFGGFGGGFPGGAYSSRGGGGRRGFSHDFAF